MRVVWKELRPSSMVGLGMMALGLTLLLVNRVAAVPDSNAAYLALELLLLGGLVAAGGWAWNRSLVRTGTISLLLVAALGLLSAGLAIALGAFLLASQASCECLFFHGACDCGSTYNTIGDVALFFAGMGALATASALTPPLGPGPTEAQT